MRNISQEALNRGLQMKDRLLQQLFNQQGAGMQRPSMPMQNNEELMRTASMQTPQYQGYQGSSPLALAQMLRRGLGTSNGLAQRFFPQLNNIAGMGRATGIGINPNPQPFNVGINPMAGGNFGVNPLNRNAYLDFLNSMSGG